MRKTIYMSEPLTRLAEETRGTSRRTSGFSRRLGEIVERYQIMLDIDAQKLPELTDGELEIMGEIVMGSVIDAAKSAGYISTHSTQRAARQKSGSSWQERLSR